MRIIEPWRFCSVIDTHLTYYMHSPDDNRSEFSLIAYCWQQSFINQVYCYYYHQTVKTSFAQESVITIAVRFFFVREWQHMVLYAITNASTSNLLFLALLYVRMPLPKWFLSFVDKFLFTYKYTYFYMLPTIPLPAFVVPSLFEMWNYLQIN